MKRRIRHIAGLFALVAMTFALAETVWASTCAPAMDMHASDATTVEHLPSQDCMVPAAHDHEPENRGDDEGQCPLSSAAAPTCMGVASLPSHATHDIAPSPEAATGPFFELAQHDFLLNDALFHPPRA